ncbi:hypothetical protein GCM10027035_35440 [Emticicia sediminis]
METLTIEIKNPKAKKLIDDLVELDLIALLTPKPSWNDLWTKLDTKLPQTEPEISEDEIIAEIKAYRDEKRSKTV